MCSSAHKTEGVNRTHNMRIHLFAFTGKEKDSETGSQEGRILILGIFLFLLNMMETLAHLLMN